MEPSVTGWRFCPWLNREVHLQIPQVEDAQDMLSEGSDEKLRARFSDHCLELDKIPQRLRSNPQFIEWVIKEVWYMLEDLMVELGLQPRLH